MSVPLPTPTVQGASVGADPEGSKVLNHGATDERGNRGLKALCLVLDLGDRRTMVDDVTPDRHLRVPGAPISTRS
jgi:hypothetical protein